MGQLQKRLSASQPASQRALERVAKSQWSESVQGTMAYYDSPNLQAHLILLLAKLGLASSVLIIHYAYQSWELENPSDFWPHTESKSRLSEAYIITASPSSSNSYLNCFQQPMHKSACTSGCMHLFLRIREREKKTSIRGGRMCQNLLGELRCLIAFGEGSEWCDSSSLRGRSRRREDVLYIGLCADVKLLSQYITA